MGSDAEERAARECREADGLVDQWRQAMATDDIMVQVMADPTLDEAIERYGRALALVDPFEPPGGRAIYGYVHAVILRCSRERQLRGELSADEAGEPEVISKGILGRAQSLARDMFSRGIALNTGPLLVEMLLADWDLRARADALEEGLAVAHEGIRRASHLDAAVRSGAIAAEDAEDARAEAQLALARVLAARPPDPQARDETEATAAAFRSACQRFAELGREVTRGSTRMWGEWALQRARWGDVVEAFSYIESALTNGDLAAVRPEDVVREMSSLTSVATNLAFARAMAGRPKEAIEGLEITRGLVWSAALSRRRTSPADLAGMRPAVDHLTATMPDATVVFLVPGSLAGIALLARHGEPVRAELLSELTATAVEWQLGRFDGALKARRGRSEGEEVLVVGDDGMEDLTPQARLDALTSWLWDAAMRRVLASAAGTSRIVMVPTGMLVAAPLHAAWRPQPGGRRRYVLDDVDVVYFPTAAMAPRDTPEPLGPQAEVLVVQEPQPVSARRLEMAQVEAAAVTHAFPNTTFLLHEQATREAVLEGLGNHRLAHLICHGRSDQVSPLKTHLVMSNDEQLNVEDLIERDLSTLRLVVLSACESASASTHLPEAAVSLPAALLSAGASGVLGTLWEADDAATALTMAVFYRNLTGRAATSRPVDPPRVLRDAQLWVRDSTNAMKAEAFPDFVRPPRMSSERAMALWAAARTPSLQWAGFVYSGR